MELIIDFDNIKDPGKKEWLLKTLKLMSIDFRAIENRQGLDEYNQGTLKRVMPKLNAENT